MKQRIIHTILLLAWLAGSSAFGLVETRHREYPLTKEERLRIELEISFGTVTIKKGSAQRVAIIDYEENAEVSQKLTMTYKLDGTTGILRIALKDNVKVFNTDENQRNERKVTLCITERVPVELNVALGAGTCEIDLSNILLESFSLSAGASSVELYSSVPNQVTARTVEIESGVGKFVGRNLANLNFQELKFEGGVGSYSLDFDGKLKQTGRVKIEVGVGSVTVRIPRHIHAKIEREENWLSGFRVSSEFEKQARGYYLTKNFLETEPHLIVRVESGIGSVNIRQK